jgi:hypothetical protein
MMEDSTYILGMDLKIPNDPLYKTIYTVFIGLEILNGASCGNKLN